MADPPILDPFQPGAAKAERPTGGKTSSLAVLSLSASLSGFVCFPALGGLLGVIFGVAAKNEISREGRGGNGLAIAGIALGGLNLVLSVAALGALLMWLPSLSSPKPRATAVYPTTPPIAPPTLPFAPPSVAPAPAPVPAAASADTSVVRTHVGKVTLVDLSRDAGSLTDLLDAERTDAKKHGEKLVLWLVVPGCKPCNGVAAALPDARMQRALGGTRLVRANVREFVGELTYLGLPSDKIPGFVLLSDQNRPMDYVHGGEWDEDVPANIAPVLGKFVTGQYTKRRDPWRGTRREDETAL
ncbi:MAG: DUF4190 domain-containing protein [Polyangiaceae bacterium]